jgi:hypothetical protein
MFPCYGTPNIRLEFTRGETAVRVLSLVSFVLNVPVVAVVGERVDVERSG